MKGSDTLVEELELIENSISASTAHGRRIAIRSVFSALEVLVAEMGAILVKQPLPNDLANHEERHKYFLELCALSNISYRIDDRGQLQLEHPNIPLKQRVLFVMNMSARITGSEISPKGDDGWRKFLEATKIRNRITHPKNQDDLEVSRLEYDIVVEALKWFVRWHHRANGGTQY